MAPVRRLEQRRRGKWKYLPVLLLPNIQALFLSSANLNINQARCESFCSDEADLIVQRSFTRSYAHILPCDDESESLSWNPEDRRACMEKTRDYVDASDNITVPWWFRTLLRDITAKPSGVYGPWHHLSTTNPLIHFCAIGKVGTSEWRQLVTKLNEGRGWSIKQTEDDADAPRAVFLRDPLERLLSGYLDKCHDANKRKGEGHCEPNVVFNPPKGGLRNANNETYANLLEGLENPGNQKLMFGAYVDVLPLKWNVHFPPQALYCDLHRNIDKYDFVGTMGKDFYFELDRMANRFGGRLPGALNSSFGYIDCMLSQTHDSFAQGGGAHPRHAPEKVARFYTARTVRKALEFLSIDYVTLGLRVPHWARQMLREDEGPD